MPGTVSGASSSVAIDAAAAEAVARQADAGGNAEQQAADDGRRAEFEAGEDGAAEVGQDGGIPVERVAARREQDQLLVEHAEVERQQQRHDDQRGAGRRPARARAARSAARAMPSRRLRVDGMALLLAVMPPSRIDIAVCKRGWRGMPVSTGRYGRDFRCLARVGKGADAPRITCRIIECRYVATLIRHPPRD